MNDEIEDIQVRKIGSDLFEDPYQEAKKLGLDVVLPKANELFIDIDNPADEDWLHLMLGVLEDNGIIVMNSKETTSKSGGKHVYLELPERELTPLERVALQACIGSDRKRELLSLLRIWLMAERPPTTFFEVPVKKGASAKRRS